MRISAKGRYALAAVIEIARNSNKGENVTVLSLAVTLGISKIYLEQVFTQLKKAGILLSTKGSRGGYQLSQPPGKITAWEVLAALEAVLTDPAESTVNENAPEIEAAMDALVFSKLDSTVRGMLAAVTILELVEFSEKQKSEQSFMLNM